MGKMRHTSNIEYRTDECQMLKYSTLRHSTLDIQHSIFLRVAARAAERERPILVLLLMLHRSLHCDYGRSFGTKPGQYPYREIHAYHSAVEISRISGWQIPG